MYSRFDGFMTDEVPKRAANGISQQHKAMGSNVSARRFLQKENPVISSKHQLVIFIKCVMRVAQ